MEVCSICNDKISPIVNSSASRELQKILESLPILKKKELHQIKILSSKFANKKICIDCYIQKVVYLKAITKIETINEIEKKLK